MSYGSKYPHQIYGESQQQTSQHSYPAMQQYPLLPPSHLQGSYIPNPPFYENNLPMIPQESFSQGMAQGQGSMLSQGQNSMPIQSPQLTVIQRISSVVKSQLPYLQSMMLFINKKSHEEKVKRQRERQRQRSRSRSRERGRRNPKDNEWTCQKCSFYNFDFRDHCRKCNQPKHQSRNDPKTYHPNPDDWRCPKCNNINYARRTQCHRCHLPKQK